MHLFLHCTQSSQKMNWISVMSLDYWGLLRLLGPVFFLFDIVTGASLTFFHGCVYVCACMCVCVILYMCMYLCMYIYICLSPRPKFFLWLQIYIPKCFFLSLPIPHLLNSYFQSQWVTTYEVSQTLFLGFILEFSFYYLTSHQVFSILTPWCSIDLASAFFPIAISLVQFLNILIK